MTTTLMFFFYFTLINCESLYYKNRSALKEQWLNLVMFVNSKIKTFRPYLNQLIICL